MAAAALDPAEILGSLLRAEQADVFAYLAGEADPYMGQKSGALRLLLPAMVATEQRREGQLAAMVDEMGGMIRPANLSAEVQYLAYLSAEYLLPKLIEARQRAITRYEDAIESLADGPAEAVSLLKGQLAELRQEMEQLRAAQ